MANEARDTDLDWEKIATENPYWGVLSEERYRGRELQERERAAFFSSGEVYVDDLVGFLNKHFQAGPHFGRVLDFGCGVGRLALAFSRYADEVVGADVSASMVELCKANAQRLGVANLTAIVSDDSLANIEGNFDVLNSLIVLQHVPPVRGMKLIRTLLGKLAIGGIASLQMTYCKERRHLQHEFGRARYYRREGRRLDDVRDISSDAPAGSITMYDYDLNEIFALASEVAGHPLTVLPTNDDGHLGVHLIFEKARNVFG